jgi:type II secretory pathway component PulK
MTNLQCPKAESNTGLSALDPSRKAENNLGLSALDIGHSLDIGNWSLVIAAQLRSRKRRSGVVLLAVLVVIALLTLAAYQYSQLMLAEYQAAASYTRAAQARALADSGVHYTAALLSTPDNITNLLNGNPYDNPQFFSGIAVGSSDSPRMQGRFSIVAPLTPDDPAFGTVPYRFGVIDESGKINLNALMKLDSSGQVAHDILLKLSPNLTEDIVNSILDWIDPDDTPRSNGAENDYYSGLSPAYRCKNAPLDSLEELLLVKGMSAPLLFGNDRNRNGQLDPDEDDGTGVVDLGLSAYLTIYSREANVDSTGNPRIYVNDSDVNGLYTKLQNAVGDELATYITAYRLYGPAPASTESKGQASRPPSPRGSGGGGGGSGVRLSRSNLSMTRPPRSISSLYELINTSVSIPATTPGGQATSYPSPLNDPSNLKQLLPTLLDKVTTSKDAELPARVNINTASPTVLAALPGLQTSDVQNIVNNRPNPSSTDTPDAIYQTPAWLITQANFQPSTLQTLEKYITARSQVFRVQVVGYFDGGGPTSRIEAVIDGNNGRPRILYWRDLTELGKGFNLTTQNQQR